MKKNIRGFTLIELLLVIIILGILAALIMGNISNSLKKGRDARRKADLNQIRSALEIYYEDKGAYPSTISFDQPLTDADTGKIYIKRVPDDPLSVSSYTYYYCVSTDYQSYQLYAFLENSQDPQIITPAPLANCVDFNCGTGIDCNYGTSTPNTTP